MFRTLCRAGTLAVLIGCTLIAGKAQAAFDQSFGFNGVGTSTNSGDLANATLFNNIYLTTNGSGTGNFSPLASLPLLSPAVFNPTTGTIGTTPISFSTTSATGFNFTNSTYGTFTQNTMAVLKASATSTTVPTFLTSVTYYIVGSFSGGVIGAPALATVTITLTQNGGPQQPLSASGTLVIPNSIPEPASLALLGAGLAGVALLRRRMTA